MTKKKLPWYPPSDLLGGYVGILYVGREAFGGQVSKPEVGTSRLLKRPLQDS
jgi:hypothetical protein